MSSVIRIYLVISIAQLEPVISILDLNQYRRKINLKLPLVINKNNINKDKGKDGKLYNIKRVLNKRITKDKFWYLIKWKDYGNEYNV